MISLFKLFGLIRTAADAIEAYEKIEKKIEKLQDKNDRILDTGTAPQAVWNKAIDEKVKLKEIQKRMRKASIKDLK